MSMSFPKLGLDLDSGEQESSVEIFKQLIRFKTISFEGPSNGEYNKCVTYIQELIEKRVPSAKTQVMEFVKGKPVLFCEIPGKDPSAQGILLNSHYDVVPVMREHWEKDIDPFEAIERDGRIYGRGAQDMKCVCAQYLSAIIKLSKEGVQLERTLFLTFVPDEEIGGVDGLGKFISSAFFNEDLKQRIGVVFDEGLANTGDGYTVFYGERMPLWIDIEAKGPTGHGSRFIPDTAIAKLMNVCNKALELREEQRKDFEGHHGCSHAEAKKLGDVLTLNLTVLKAGVETGNGSYAVNVIPTEARASFDVRVPVTWSLPKVYDMLDEWTKEEGLSWKFSGLTEHPGFEHHVTEIDVNSKTVSPFWKQFLMTFDKMGLKVEPEIFPAGTDSRFVRKEGLPALGFSPMRNSPVLLHEHNEYLDRNVYLEGIIVYLEILNSLGNMA